MTVPVSCDILQEVIIILIIIIREGYMERYSRQREAIREYLKDRKDHPTAEEIYGALKKTIPNLSLATVYRNLSQMAEKGELRKLANTAASSDRFDPDLSDHRHFICRNCGMVMDVPMPASEDERADVAKTYSVSVDSVQVMLYGLCEKCRRLTEA